MEPNPYEPPREKEPLTTGKIAKRGLVGAIILLTPVAVAIALGGSCAATYAVLGIATISGAANTRMVISVLLVLWVVPPAMVLTAMIRWAIKTHRRVGRIGGIELKPEESPKHKKSLWEQLVQFPTVSSLALLILTVAVISAIFFTWLAYSLPGPNRAGGG